MQGTKRYRCSLHHFFVQRTLGIGTILLDIAGIQYNVHTCFFQVFIISSQHIQNFKDGKKYVEDVIAKWHSDPKIGELI